MPGRCPRCAAPTLFAGLLDFAPSCAKCSLDFTQFTVGDGPAAFLTLIIGTLVTALAIWLQLAAQPPFWVHIVIWVPLSIILVIVGLRISKAALLKAEYRRSAGQVRSVEDDPE